MPGDAVGAVAGKAGHPPQDLDPRPPIPVKLSLAATFLVLVPFHATALAHPSTSFADPASAPMLAVAADIEGKWEYTQDGGGNPFEVEFENHWWHGRRYRINGGLWHEGNTWSNITGNGTGIIHGAFEGTLQNGDNDDEMQYTGDNGTTGTFKRKE